MALTNAQMLEALHKADPKTLKNRYTPAQVAAAYNKTVGSKTPPAEKKTPPANGWNESKSEELKKLSQVKNPNEAQKAQIDNLKNMRNNKNAPADTTGTGGTTGTSGGTSGSTGTGSGEQKTNEPPPPSEGGEQSLDPNSPIGSAIANAANKPGIHGIIPDNDVNRLAAQTKLGEEFGNSVIKSQGLEGDFLGRVDTGPSAATLDATAKNKALADNAGNLTANEQEAIDRNRAALGGLNAQENTALREQGEAGLDSTMQTLMRKQASNNAASGIQGSAAGARYNPIYRDRMEQGRGLQRDVLVANIAEKARARQAFTDLVTGRADETFRRQGAANAAYSGDTKSNDAFTRAGQQGNIELGAREKATRVGTILGGVGTVGTALGGFSAEDFQKKAYEESLQAQKEAQQKELDFADRALKSQENIYKKLGK